MMGLIFQCPVGTHQLGMLPGSHPPCPPEPTLRPIGFHFPTERLLTAVVTNLSALTDHQGFSDHQLAITVFKWSTP